MINVLTEPGLALAGAIKLAQRISENGPLAIQTAKRLINEGLDWSSDQMFDLQRPRMAHIFSSLDAREGSTAFAEKRKPVWQGK